MRINHNINALTAWRQITMTNSVLSKTLERLSSGYKINRAADDAAGLAISEKMRNQITGLNMATKNAQDGISLIQTAEGALNETHAILQRMRELAVQATNDTNTNDDRAQIQQEFDQLIEEIDRIGNNTEFNTKKLLNGAIGVSLSDDSDYFNAVESTSDTKNGVYTVTFTDIARRGVIHDARKFTQLGSNVTVDINGVDISLGSSDTLDQIVSKINVKTDDTGVQALVGGNGGLVLRTTNWGSDAKVSISVSDANVLVNLGLEGANGTVTTLTDAGEDTVGKINGATAVGDGVYMQLITSGNNAQGLKVQELMSEVSATTATTVVNLSSGTVTVSGVTYTYENALFINGEQVPVANASGLGSIVNYINQHQALYGASAATSGGKLVLNSIVNGPEAEITVVQAKHGSYTGSTAFSTTASTEALTINGVRISITADATIASFIAEVNAHTASTGVVASNAGVSTAVFRTVGTANVINISSIVASDSTKLGIASGVYGGTLQVIDEDHGSVGGITSSYTAANVTAGATSASSTLTNAATITINGVSITINPSSGAANGNAARAFVKTINAHTGSTGVYGTVSAGKVVLYSTQKGAGAQINISNISGSNVWGLTTGTWYGTENLAGPQGNVTVNNDNVLRFHIGANRDQRIEVSISDMRADAIGKGVTGINNSAFTSLEALKYVGVSTRENAEDAIKVVDQAIKDVSTERAKIGAYQNRLEHTINNLTVASENLTAAESRIRDADMAKEMMIFTKTQILLQTGTAMLAQANAAPQNILQLLR